MQVIAAPSNLGLRPLRPGHEPGTWRAPAALFAAGLLPALGSPRVIELPRPTYSAEPQSGTRLLNGHGIRAFNLALANVVDDVLDGEDFPLVIGGDCSVLLGALAGGRRRGPISLVHVDGHSDFRHPDNYDFTQNLGAVAGMDLALATGRGEALVTSWPGVPFPLVADADVVQVGERENRDPDFAWPDINETAINRIDVFEALTIGPDGVVARIGEVLGRVPDQGFWVHFDVDVMDQAIMPAVDSPGSPGIDPQDLVAILGFLVARPMCRGMTVTVYDPELDPDGKCADTIVSILSRLPFPVPRHHRLQRPSLRHVDQESV